VRLGKLNTVKLVSLIHGGWGLAILLFYPFGIVMPRPYGSQEAFLVYMPPWGMATLMLSGAIISRIALHIKEVHPFFAVFAVLPQQTILMWSAIWGLFHLSDGDANGNFDARGALALVYLGALSFYHALDVSELWTRASLKRAKNGISKPD
jgi:hypothetical protein